MLVPTLMRIQSTVLGSFSYLHLTGLRFGRGSFENRERRVSSSTTVPRASFCCDTIITSENNTHFLTVNTK
jgi:hypothetical protein